MANTPKGMTDEEIGAFIQKLDEMPVKKKTVYSNREVAAMHSERILSFMEEKGYSFQDVAEMMARTRTRSVAAPSPVICVGTRKSRASGKRARLQRLK